MKYYQCYLCRLNEGRGSGHSGEQLKAWIPDYGAKVGAAVELKGEDGWWEVVNVYDPPFDEKWLVEKRKRDRNKNSFSSIKEQKK